MATAAELQARLETLKKALATGTKTVSYDVGGGNKMVTFRDIAEIKAAISAVEQDLAAANGSNIVRTFSFTSDKAL